MSVTLVGEKREGQGSLKSSSGIAIYEATYHYLLETTSRTTTREDVLDASGMPTVGVTVDATGFALCKSKDVTRRADNPFLWDGTAVFSSAVDDRQSNQDPDTDPEAWVPVYETKFERLQEIVTLDVNGFSVRNSAGQPFDNGLTISRFIPIWEFYQFESANLSDQAIIDRNEVVNQVAFRGKGPKTLLLTVMSSVVGYYYGAARRLTQYSIKYNPRDWRHKRLDVGTEYIENGVAKNYIVNPDDPPEQWVVKRGPLNGHGGKQPIGMGPEVLYFDVYPAVSFSFLRT